MCPTWILMSVLVCLAQISELMSEVPRDLESLSNSGLVYCSTVHSESLVTQKTLTEAGVTWAPLTHLHMYGHRKTLMGTPWPPLSHYQWSSHTQLRVPLPPKPVRISWCLQQVRSSMIGRLEYTHIFNLCDVTPWTHHCGHTTPCTVVWAQSLFPPSFWWCETFMWQTLPLYAQAPSSVLWESYTCPESYSYQWVYMHSTPAMMPGQPWTQGGSNTYRESPISDGKWDLLHKSASAIQRVRVFPCSQVL